MREGDSPVESEENVKYVGTSWYSMHRVFCVCVYIHTYICIYIDLSVFCLYLYTMKVCSNCSDNSF